MGESPLETVLGASSAVGCGRVRARLTWNNFASFGVPWEVHAVGCVRSSVCGFEGIVRTGRGGRRERGRKGVDPARWCCGRAVRVSPSAQGWRILSDEHIKEAQAHLDQNVLARYTAVAPASILSSGLDAGSSPGLDCGPFG